MSALSHLKIVLCYFSLLGNKEKEQQCDVHLSLTQEVQISNLKSTSYFLDFVKSAGSSPSTLLRFSLTDSDMIHLVSQINLSIVLLLSFLYYFLKQEGAA